MADATFSIPCFGGIIVPLDTYFTEKITISIHTVTSLENLTVVLILIFF
jgi:hypothetical protein